MTAPDSAGPPIASLLLKFRVALFRDTKSEKAHKKKALFHR